MRFGILNTTIRQKKIQKYPTEKKLENSVCTVVHNNNSNRTAMTFRFYTNYVHKFTMNL